MGCLEHFRQTPFVQVNSRGECEYHATSHSFWLTTSSNRNDFDAPRSDIRSDDSRIARCRVCRRIPEVGDFDNDYDYPMKREVPAGLIPLRQELPMWNLIVVSIITQETFKIPRK